MKDLRRLYWKPDIVGRWLGTGMDRFYWRTEQGVVKGLGKIVEPGIRLEIVAVQSNPKGKGLLREFIEWLKCHYREIIVWEVINGHLSDALIRYGFKFHIERDQHCQQTGWRWEQAPSQPIKNWPDCGQPLNAIMEDEIRKTLEAGLTEFIEETQPLMRMRS